MNTIKNKSPVVVNVSKVEIQSERYSFYTPAFVVESESTERYVEVFELKDLIKAGFTTDSNAFRYCQLAFAQKQRVKSVFIISKKPTETFLEALLESPLGKFYYISIETHDVDSVLEISTYFLNNGIDKLLFISKYEDISSKISGRKNIVWWWTTDFWFWDSSAIVIRDNSDGLELELKHFPEAAWISRCANVFPSQMQWSCKELIGVYPTGDFTPQTPQTAYGWEVEEDLVVLWDSDKSVSIQYPQEYDLSGHINPSEMPLVNHYDTIHEDNVSWGSGTTADGEWIDHRVFEDWMKWAIQRNVWKLFKASPKVNATKSGLDSIEMKIKEVLDFSVEQSGISNYKITSRSFDRYMRSSKFNFTYEREHAIIGVVQVNGTVYS